METRVPANLRPPIKSHPHSKPQPDRRSSAARVHAETKRFPKSSTKINGTGPEIAAVERGKKRRGERRRKKRRSRELELYSRAIGAVYHRLYRLIFGEFEEAAYLRRTLDSFVLRSVFVAAASPAESKEDTGKGEGLAVARLRMAGLRGHATLWVAVPLIRRIMDSRATPWHQLF